MLQYGLQFRRLADQPDADPVEVCICALQNRYCFPGVISKHHRRPQFNLFCNLPAMSLLSSTVQLTTHLAPRVNDAALNVTVSLGFTSITFVYESIDHDQHNLVLNLAPVLRKMLIFVLCVVFAANFILCFSIPRILMQGTLSQ